MCRIRARLAVIATTATAALTLAAGAASAHPEDDTCNGIAACTGDIVSVGDIDVNVLNQVHLLHGHH